MKNKSKQKTLMEAVDRLNDLQDDYLFVAEMNKTNGKNIDMITGAVLGIQKAKEELYVMMEKYE